VLVRRSLAAQLAREHRESAEASGGGATAAPRTGIEHGGSVGMALGGQATTATAQCVQQPQPKLDAAAGARAAMAPLACAREAAEVQREAARVALTARFDTSRQRSALAAAAVVAAADDAANGRGSPRTLTALRGQLRRQRESLERQQAALRDEATRRRCGALIEQQRV
jgi:hypothetical protein